ncbi:NAD+ synthase [candidate division KSB1 bacterium]|nr:NAD+ synthase [candidate division KSB1 bacterium]RQW09258.1 MAG: NAD+ synthase [candidate division KSB1 bacterium]
MNTTIRIALAQINTTVGDLDGNYEKIIRTLKTARAERCHLVAFPELTITGYPPEDLVLRRQFIQDQKKILSAIAAQVDDIACIVGFVDESAETLHNSAAVLQNGDIKAVYHKIELPNYSVFDEERYFAAGEKPLVISLNDILIGISICEDIWIPDSVAEAQALHGGAEILLNISASPFAVGKGRDRIELLQKKAEKTAAIVAYDNLVGGQDELVFDGQSLIIGPDGEVWRQGAAFAEELIIHDLDVATVRRRRRTVRLPYAASDLKFRSCERVKLATEERAAGVPQKITPVEMTLEEEIYGAIILGLRDYVHKNGFQQVVFGLSGGIDSALVATLAADALGPQNVNCITMPSQHSSAGSVVDSIQLAENLGIKMINLSITDIYRRYLELLQELFAGREPDVAEENLQARIRGTIVMALSNKFGWLPLATGNKSELSVGYCTIYGDMVGGFAPLKDVTKTMVYKLSNDRNAIAGFDLIPRSIIEKAPSAELRPNQKDQDSLPPYDELDAILELYVEKRQGVSSIVAQGYRAETVQRVARLVDLNEYKRRQAAPGVKITHLAFGKDRRVPITNHYKGR